MLGYPRLSSVRPQLSPSYPGLSSVILGYPGFTLNYPWHLLPQLGSPWLPSVVLGYPCARDLSPPPRPTPPRLSVLSNLIAILVRFLQTTLSSPGLSPVILGSPPVIPELSWVTPSYPGLTLKYPRVSPVILGSNVMPIGKQRTAPLHNKSCRHVKKGGWDCDTREKPTLKQSF